MIDTGGNKKFDMAKETLIPFLKKHQFKQYVREVGPESHLKKQGTPTMGGIIMIIAIAIVTTFISIYYIYYLYLFLILLIHL